MIEIPEPDLSILNRRPQILRDLEALVSPGSVIASSDELRAYETDALTAYRRVPLAVVLPTTTEEVSSVLSYCNENSIKIVARGAGTSLAGGAIPQEDAVVVGLSKMNRVLSINYANRSASVQAGITNLAVSQAVGSEGFFYAPDPSSQQAPRKSQPRSIERR